MLCVPAPNTIFVQSERESSEGYFTVCCWRSPSPLRVSGGPFQTYSHIYPLYYLNDKNSSRLRELVTLWVCGWEPYEAKLGYNGYRLTFPEGPREWCEVEPQNTDNPKKKLDGGGSFNDYTLERWEKDKKANPTMLISGFVEGKLVYVFEVKFSCISERLHQILKKRFPEKRQKGEYLRSASFSLKDYKDCEQFRLAYLRADWEAFADYLSRDLHNFLSQCQTSHNT